MPTVHVQLSIYPLRQPRLGPAIDKARTILIAHGFQPEVGSMSTHVTGELNKVFAALTEAFTGSAADGDVVMVIAVQNA